MRTQETHHVCRRSRLWAWLVLLGAMLASTGCGYQTQGLHREGITTVAVEMFSRGQNVYRRDLEIRLTEAVVKVMEAETPYKQTTKARADTLLTGTLEKISQRVLSLNPDTSLPREMEMTLTVSLRWTDLRTGDDIVKRSNLRASGTYIPHDPLNEDFFAGSEDVINRLARRIVEQMESDWPTPGE